MKSFFMAWQPVVMANTGCLDSEVEIIKTTIDPLECLSFDGMNDSFFGTYIGGRRG